MRNKKIVIIIGLVILIVGVLGFVGFDLYQKDKKQRAEDKLISEIMNSYAPYVMLKKDKTLYTYNDNKYLEVGNISEGIILPLVKKQVKDTNDIYFQVKDTDYYIDYKNLSEVRDYEKDTSLDNYIVTNSIKTNPTNLYQNDKLMVTINEEKEFDILMKDTDKYYVKFLDKIYYVKDSYELVDKESVETLKDISVLNFSDNITLDKLKSVLSFLQENKYQTITIDDFKKWINGQVNLEKNIVLLLSYKELDSEKQNLVSEYNYTINTNLEEITFTSGDTKLKIGDVKYYKYEVNNNTSIDRVKDMLNGVKEVKVTTSSGPGVAVLNYHFFYDSNTEQCNETICISNDNFRKQLSYLKENGYKTLTMAEFNDWMDGKIEVPGKSVLITVDDGAAGTFNHLPQILNEYQMNATLFLISGWWPVSRYQSSSYLEIQSHSHNLHDSNYCDSNGCGYKTLKLSKEELISDLKTSISTIGTSTAFCYPFYQTNAKLVQAVKESGFKLGFVGGNKKATRSNNKYYIPRYVIYKNTSLESFKRMVG